MPSQQRDNGQVRDHDVKLWYCLCSLIMPCVLNADQMSRELADLRVEMQEQSHKIEGFLAEQEAGAESAARFAELESQLSLATSKVA